MTNILPGVTCSSRCELGFWGVDCTLPCSCSNKGSCDQYTGLCECNAGYTDTQCNQGKIQDHRHIAHIQCHMKILEDILHITLKFILRN